MDDISEQLEELKWAKEAALQAMFSESQEFGPFVGFNHDYDRMAALFDRLIHLAERSSGRQRGANSPCLNTACG